MCHAMPVQVTQMLDYQRALVNLGGIEKEISVLLLNEVQAGDYVILHAGYALTKLDEQDAQKTLSLFAAMIEKGL